MRSVRRRVMMTTAVPVVLAAIACGDNRGGDVPRIRAALERMPGVRVIDVVGWDEMWPVFGPEDIRADLQVGEKGRLRLCDLTVKTVTEGGPFILARVGDWSPNAEFEPFREQLRHVAGCPASVDVKPGSAFLQLLPFELESPADAISNYAQLERLIASWPEHPSSCDAKDGVGQIRYWRTRFVE